MKRRSEPGLGLRATLDDIAPTTKRTWKLQTSNLGSRAQMQRIAIDSELAGACALSNAKNRNFRVAVSIF